jgi:hypothetical protein
MAIPDILTKRHNRRTFYALVLLSASLLVLVRYFVLPTVDPLLSLSLTSLAARIVEALFASLIITFALGWFVFWMTPEVMSRAQVEVIEPRAIGTLLERALLQSSTWAYKGNAGRFLRTMTLPQMARGARNASLPRQVTALILDPTDEDACGGYSNYRRSLLSAKSDGTEWTADRVRRELYATILAVAVIQRREPLLQINLGLINRFSSFRLDLSSDYVLITKEDAFAPAIRCDKDTYFYDSYLHEIQLALRQARPVTFLVEPPDLTTAVPSEVEKFFDTIGLRDPRWGETDLAHILGLVREGRNPYRR